MRLAEINGIRRIKGWWDRFRRRKEIPREPSSLERMRFLFEQEKVSYRLIPYLEIDTAPNSVDSIKVCRGELAKVVLVSVDGEDVMAVLPADRQIDLIRFAKVTRARRISLVREREIRKHFPDCEVGAIPPFGNLYGFPVCVDESVARGPGIVFPVSSHRVIIEIRIEDFKRLTYPWVDHFVQEPLERASGF